MQKLFDIMNEKDVKKAALDGNFFNKRKRDTKLEWCEDFLINRFNDWIIEPNDLCNWLETNPPLSIQKRQKADADVILAGENLEPEKKELQEGYSGVFVTAAQNNTAIAEGFKELKDFCDSLNLRLIILPIYYNKNAFSAAVEDEGERFDPELTPYMVFNDTALYGGNVVLRPEAAILPTAKMPINKAVELNRGEVSTVVAATKQQHRTLPRSPATRIKEAWATGAITETNYIRGGAGASAANDHRVGGIAYFNYADDKVMSRNIQFKNGHVYDVEFNTNPLVMTLGDIHSEMKEPVTWIRTLTMVEEIQPRLLVVHDILHFSTRSHHNRNDGLHLYKTQNDFVTDDLKRVIDDLNELAALVPEIYVCESNHNSALDNWLHDLSYNPKRDPRQAKIYYLLNWLVCDAIDDGNDEATALQVAFNNLHRFKEFPELASNVRFGSMDVAEIHAGTDFSQHGHKGQNGSGGNTNLFSKWSMPMITGHTHSPAIVGDVVTVGVTASLKQGYNSGGASSWRQSHAVTHANGFTQLLHVWAV